MADNNSIDPTRKPNVLALGPQDVCPPVDGGKESIHGALGALACHAQVTYAYPGNAESGADGYATIGVTGVAYPHFPKERPASILRATLAGKPYKFEKYGSDAAVSALNAAVPSIAFTAIVCHHAHTYGLARRFAQVRGLNVPIVVREHNIEYSLVESYRNSLSGVKRVAASLFAFLTRREELRIWRQADAVVFLSDQDLRAAQVATAPSSVRFFLAREGVPLPPRRPTFYPGTKAPLLVLLNPKATQSVLNLRDFVHRYWLPLREQHLLNNETLNVTGVSDKQLARLIELDATKMSNSGIHGLGFLPSLAPTLESSLALVSPTFVGGGIRKKVLEAMAHQLPVIATDLDIACCDYFQRNLNIVPLGDATDFANAVARLRNDQQYWLDLSDRARDAVEEFANWECYADSMLEIIKKLTNHVRYS
jgi:hypothetical protein